MIRCPVCGTLVQHQGQDKEFNCTQCRQGLVLRLEPDGSPWLKVNLVSKPDGKDRSSAPRPNKPPFDKIDQLNLSDTWIERRDVWQILDEIKKDIKQTKRLRNRGVPDDPETMGYNAKLQGYERQQKEWKSYETQLFEHEVSLRQETTTPASTASRSGSGGMVVGCGIILAAATLFAFTYWIGLQLNFRLGMIIGVISIVAGLLTWVIAQFK